ncbi:hypothetical protein QBC32DRAFT_386013 [Pseudoneurospora amorphoporcata]|uniref:Uncharacterized protein n=1 Tax=Pseudoneurospora amorphoporcata TaxID=241081 RepID=A0AAN6NNT3_9PEZI|nr:hypothetical protein QBC32DRAFT_386013 [Pseudoneurospora amorphoporcata]
MLRGFHLPTPGDKRYGSSGGLRVCRSSFESGPRVSKTWNLGPLDDDAVQPEITPGPGKRQSLGPGWSDFHPGDGNTIPTCEISLPIKQQPPCIFFPIPGEIRPGKRSFSLPADYATNTKQVILQLEKQLVALQNKKNKTPEDIADIRAIKAALKYLERPFSLPGDYASDTKKVILQLEKQLVALQNKKDKTDEDVADIQALKSALKFLAGIDQISAPPGTETGFVPGKRDAPSVGSYVSVCPGLEGAEIALETPLHKSKPSVQEYIIIQKLTNFLAGCGITIVKSPDGTWTILKPSDKKRGVDTEVTVATPKLVADFDLAGLEESYHLLLESTRGSQPSFVTWLALRQIADLLELYGAPVYSAISSASATSKRQITIGTGSCQLLDILGLKAALAALMTAYGDPAKAPTNIFLIEQILVTAIQLCGQGVPGWTTLTPGNPIPGGPLVPDPTIPGGPIKPDPYVPGGEIRPGRRDVDELDDPTTLLDALQVLEAHYGGYESGTIPAPLFLIMLNLVTILQEVYGVTVKGWPTLGQGTVVLTPST